MNSITLTSGQTVRAAFDGEQSFSGDSKFIFYDKGYTEYYTFAEVSEDDGRVYVLTARNGTGRYSFRGDGRVRFLRSATCLLQNLRAVVDAVDSPRVWGKSPPPFISYAQIGEDILLMRALRDVSPEDGFYIDVGAYDPDQDSVTKAFYDRGWRGLNLEPSAAWFARLQAERPRDVNIQAAASSEPGRLTFYINDGEQLGTLEERFAAGGGAASRQDVDVVTLRDVCTLHAPPAIHFLKVDVEGHERNVLEGMDFDRHRPWIVIVEAVAPNRPDIPTFGEWEDVVTGAGYRFAAADELNRYYIAQERAELADAFRLPVDSYILDREVAARQRLERRVAELEAELAQSRKGGRLASLLRRRRPPP